MAIGSSEKFTDKRRQEFRDWFQPSRIVVGVLPDPRSRSGVNLITLCFNMYCSYKPPMMAFSIFRGAYSYGLAEAAGECVLAVPGEKLASVALQCGLKSGREVDKVGECGLHLVPSLAINTPGISEAIANIEMRIVERVRLGDHLLIAGEVERFAVDTANSERNLISVGSVYDGYEVLAASGIHRIGVVRRDPPQDD